MSRGFCPFFLAALVACGGAGRTTSDRESYPVLARVPAKAPYVVAAGRLAGASRLLRDLVGLVGPVDVAIVDSELRTFFGVSAIDAADLADVGFDPEGSIAVFGAIDRGHTLLLPVAHRSRVDDLLTKLTTGATGDTREHAGTVMQRYRYDAGWFVAFAHLPPFLAVHIGRVEDAPRGTEWLDELADRRDRFHAEITHSDGIMVVDVPALDRALSAHAPKECAEPRRAFADRWRRVLGQARFSPGELHASVIVELPGDVRRRLEQHVLELEPSWGAPALRATWRVDLAWLAARTDPSAVDASRCEGLLGLGPRFDPALLAAILPGIRAFDVTVTSARAAGDQLDLEAEAVVLAAADAYPAITARLSAGSAPETIGEITRGRHPSLLRPVEWTPAGGGLRITSGPRPAAPAEGSGVWLPLAALHYTGGKIPDLVPLSTFAQLVLFGAAALPGALVQTLGRIDALDATASLGDVSLTVSLDLVLRP